MDLARIAVKLRPRNPWEGVDLGFMLARQWFLPLWLLWMISAVPVMLVLTLLPMPLWLAGLLLWWFKPLYEPPLMFWLGRRLFGERLSWRELRSAWPRAILPQLFANLTWRRLHPSRSFLMPVSVLERLQGKARSQRIQVLSRKSNAASWLTIIGIHFEFALQLGFITLLVMLIPEELLWIDLRQYLFQPDALSEWIQQLSALLAMSMVAPFYVAGGFALYLTRRSELEGWDIELGLRRMAQRGAANAAAWLGVLCLSGLLAWGGSAGPLQAAEVDRQQVRDTIDEVLAEEAFGGAEEVTDWRFGSRFADGSAAGESASGGVGTGFPSAQVDRQQIRRTVDDVLADENFGREQEKTRWEYDGDTTDEDLDPDNPIGDWLEQWAQGLAAFGELLLWLGGGGLLAYLVYWFITNRELNIAGPGGSRNGRGAPTQIAGLDLRPESLPDDPATEAERLIEQGDYRAALSLLYRSALSALIHRYALEIPEGATEGECRRLVAQQLGQSLTGCFSGLTLHWQRQAYAHRSPGREEALTLCRQWRGCFGGAEADG